MYTYKGSLVQRTIVTSEIETPNLEFFPVVQIYLQFYKTFLILRHPASSSDIYVNMEDVRRVLAGFQGTVAEWLELNGDQTLPSTPKTDLPNPKRRSVKYVELTRGGYQLSPTRAGIFYPPGVKDSDGKIDIAVTRIETDMEDVNATSLFTVNGFIHDSASLDKISFIKDGMKSAKKANTYAAGLVSFGQMGTLERIKLKKENIAPFEESKALIDKICFTVPEYEEGKAFLFVMGGYLILPSPDLFYQIDKKKFALDLTNINFVEKLLESSGFIDLRDLELSQPDNFSQEGYFTDELFSDEVLKRYFTLSQSFFVMFSFSNLHVERGVLTHEPYPGRYISVQQPVQPLIGGYGRLMEYWPRKGKDSWEISVTDNFRRDYIYSERGWSKWKVVDKGENVTHLKRLTGAYLLDIFTIKD